jgi:hypothetical protein
MTDEEDREERSAGKVRKRIVALYVAAAMGLIAGLAGSWYVTGIIIRLWPGLPRLTLTLTIFFCGIWGVRKVYKSLKQDWRDGKKDDREKPDKEGQTRAAAGQKGQ